MPIRVCKPGESRHSMTLRLSCLHGPSANQSHMQCTARTSPVPAGVRKLQGSLPGKGKAALPQTHCITPE